MPMTRGTNLSESAVNLDAMLSGSTWPT